MRTFGYSLLYWPLLFGLGFVNGAFREFVLARLIGEAALTVSGLSLVALLAAAVIGFMRRFDPVPVGVAALIGLTWLALSLAAEVGLAALGSDDPVAVVTDSLSWPAVRAGNFVVFAFAAVALLPPLIAGWRRLS